MTNPLGNFPLQQTKCQSNISDQILTQSCCCAPTRPINPTLPCYCDTYAVTPSYSGYNIWLYMTKSLQKKEVANKGCGFGFLKIIIKITQKEAIEWKWLEAWGMWVFPKSSLRKLAISHMPGKCASISSSHFAFPKALGQTEEVQSQTISSPGNRHQGWLCLTISQACCQEKVPSFPDMQLRMLPKAVVML